MKRLAQKTALISSSTLAAMLLRIFKNKSLALLVGASGIGSLAIYQSIIALIQQLSNLNAGPGVTQAVAKLNKNYKNSKPNDLYTLYIKLKKIILNSSIFISIFIIIASPLLASFFLNEATKYWEIIGIALLTPFIFMTTFWRSWINGMQDTTALAKIILSSNIVVTVAAILLVWLYGPHGIYLSALIVPLSSFIFTRKTIKKWENQVAKPSSDYIKRFDVVSYVTQSTNKTILLSSLLFSGSLLFARAIIGQQLGFKEVGLFQAAWSILANYITVLLASVSVDLFPRLCSANNERVLAESINQQIRLSLAIATPVLTGIFLFSDTVLISLYSDEFKQAEPLLKQLILGDPFRVVILILNALLISQKHLKSLLSLQLAWSIVFCLCLLLNLEADGLLSVGKAYVLANIFSLAGYLIYTNLKMGIKLDLISYAFILSLVILNISASYFQT